MAGAIVRVLEFIVRTHSKDKKVNHSAIVHWKLRVIGYIKRFLVIIQPSINVKVTLFATE